MENVDDLKGILANMSKEELADLADSLSSKNEDRPRKKKADNPVIWAKRPSTVHLTVHCNHCKHTYTTVKHIRDNDLIYYSTTKEGKIAKTKLLAEGECCVETYTQTCCHCQVFVKSLPLEELQGKYLALLIERRTT